MRWTAAGMLEAESRFRKVPGYRGLAQIAIAIAIAIERDLIIRHRQTLTHITSKEPTEAVAV